MPGLPGKVLALDVGSSKIKWIIHSFSRKGPVLLDWGSVKISGGLLKNGRIIDAVGVETKLRDILKGSRGTITRVSLSLCCPELMVRTVELPELSRRDLERTVKYEVMQLVPEGAGEYIFDFSVLENIHCGRMKRVRVLIAAVPDCIVKEYITLFKNLGLKPYLFDFHGNSASRIIKPKQKRDGNTNRVLVDIGYSSTTITIIENGRPVFTRQMQGGGRDIINAVVAGFKITPEEAKKLIEKYDSLLIGKSKSGEGERSEIRRCIMPQVEQLFKDIYRSVEFYRSRGGMEMDSFSLVGDSSAIMGLDKYFASRLGMENVSVTVNLPVLNDGGFPKERVAQFVNVLGLAVPASKDKGIKINLLPEEYRPAKKRAKGVKILAAFLAAAAVMGALALPLHHMQQLKNKDLNLQRMLVGTNAIEEYNSRREELASLAVRRGQLVDVLRSLGKEWSCIIIEICHEKPDETVLISMDYTDQRELNLIGETANYRTAAQFVVNLQKTDGLSSVRPISVTLLENGACRFVIRCEVRGGGL